MAAERLVFEHGYDETTIEMIAADVGVVPRTFFRHFPSKEAAVFWREELWAQRLRQLLDQQAPDVAVIEALRSALVELAALIAENGASIVELHRLADEVPAIRRHMQTSVGVALTDGVNEWAQRRLGVHPVVDPGPMIAAGIASACAQAAVLRWVASSGSADFPTLIAESFDRLSMLT